MNTVKSTVELVDALRNMGVGQTLEFPAERANSVRAVCSNYGFQWDRKYTTKAVREERKVIVSRVK